MTDRFLRLPPMLLLITPLAGCGGVDTVGATPSNLAPPVASTFDPATSSRITGRVTWSGAIPQAPEFLYGVPRDDLTGFDIRMMPNPNRPAITPETRAVAGAVVFLQGVDPAAAKPWDHPPVRVELADRQIIIRQGGSGPRRVGIVKRGEPVELVSVEPVYHVLRGRGAAFFSLAFPDPNRPLTRTLDQPGRVELTSGAGFYWANANLFVADHPYFTLTDGTGRFMLDGVPPGTFELVAWLPGWTPARRDRDPETGMITRQAYAPPIEAKHRVTVERDRAANVNVSIP